MSTRPLDFYAGPMVWIDCEMTGLDPRKDKILEVAVLITNGNLDLVDDGLQYAIKTEKNVLDGMDQWCITHHGQSGLTKACLESTHTREYVTSEILKYIKMWIPQPRSGVLAGSSIHADRAFLVEEMPEVIEHLHYRVVGMCAITVVLDSLDWTSYKMFQPSRNSSADGFQRVLITSRNLATVHSMTFGGPFKSSNGIAKTSSSLQGVSAKNEVKLSLDDSPRNHFFLRAGQRSCSGIYSFSED